MTVARERGHIPIAAIGRQARIGPGYLDEELAADIRGLGPECPIVFRAPPRPQLVERRQMIGRIRTRNARLRYEADQGVLFVHHGTYGHRAWRKVGTGRRPRPAFLGSRGGPSATVRAGPGLVRKHEGRILRVNSQGRGARQQRMMAHPVKDLVGLRLIVVDALAVTPPVRREIQRHHVILLAIRGGTGRARCTVRIHRPVPPRMARSIT